MGVRVLQKVQNRWPINNNGVLESAIEILKTRDRFEIRRVI